jgi:hypothetical protein
VLRLGLVGGDPTAPAMGLDPLITKSNYLMGSDPRGWITNVPNFGKVEYQDVYPGIDLLYHGNQGQLEYDFAVAPGADPGAIRLAIRGAESVWLDGQGDLVLHTGGGDVIEQAPVAYQLVNGTRQVVASRFVLEGDNQVGFQLGAYDPRRPLVIDPTLTYSSYLGGIGYGVALDSSGNAYLAGSGGFVGKLNATGTALIYATYLGSSTNLGIVLDSTGDAYVMGYAGTPGSFPTTANAAFPTTTATYNDFFTVLNPAGSGLIYSTFLPNAVAGPYGYSLGSPGAIAIDSSGNAYLTGAAYAGFPTTANAFQPAFPGSSGNYTAFFAKINPSLSGTGSLAYATYLGGSGDDAGTGIAVDGAGNAYVAGWTMSSNFPTTGGAFQTQYGNPVRTGGGFCQGETFAAKLNPALSGAASLVYSTFLSGSATDGYATENPGYLNYDYQKDGPAIAVDGSGNAYVAGCTSGTTTYPFPTTPGAFQSSPTPPTPGLPGGPRNGFVTKLNATGSALIYSTYLGGGYKSGVNGIALDAQGDAYLTGWTLCTDFPTVNAIQAQKASGNDANSYPNSDAFVAQLNAAGSALLFSTYLGGTDDDYGNSIAVDGAGNVYVAGQTQSTNFPTTPGALQTTSSGGIVGFVAKINVASAFLVSGFPSPTPAGVAGTVTVTALNASGGTNTGYTGTIHFTSTDPHAVLPADYTFTAADQGVHTFTVTLVTAGTQSLTVTDTAMGGLSGSEGGIVVQPGAATHFLISGPTSVSAGTLFNLTVTAVDAYGNVATGYTGTVHFSDSVGGATLPANYTFKSSDSGVHTFTGLKLKTKGWQTITVVDTLNNSILGTWTIDVT